MMNANALNLWGAVASVCALFIVVAQLVWRLAVKTKQTRQEAEAALAELLSDLQAAGQTLPARTDLGFLVNIELGSLRESIASWRFTVMLGTVGCTLGGLAAIVTPPQPRLVMYTILAALLLLLAAVVYAFVSLRREEEYAYSFAHRVKEVWERPVARRLESPRERQAGADHRKTEDSGLTGA